MGVTSWLARTRDFLYGLSNEQWVIAVRFIAACLLLIVFTVIFSRELLCNHREVVVPPNDVAPRQNPLEKEYVAIHSVCDGDTLRLGSDPTIRIRLLGVDTPESVHPNKPVEHLALAASAYTKELMKQAGYKARLEIDGHDHDKYGRWVRRVFVWLPNEGEVDLAVKLLKRGLARGCPGFRFSDAYHKVLRKAEVEAWKNGRGWPPPGWTLESEAEAEGRAGDGPGEPGHPPGVTATVQAPVGRSPEPAAIGQGLRDTGAEAQDGLEAAPVARANS